MLPLILFGLLAIQDPDIDALLKQLADESIETREKAFAALLDLGRKVEPAVRRRIDSSANELKARYERLLAALIRKRKLEAMLPPLKNLAVTFDRGTVSEFSSELVRHRQLMVAAGPVATHVITPQLRDVPFLEALDRVCEAADCRSLWSQKGTPELRFVAGPYLARPRKFVRHYGVSVESVKVLKTNEKEPVLTRIEMDLAWDPAVRPTYPTVEISSVIDDLGRPIEIRRPPDYRLVRESSRLLREFTLFAPAAGATRIASLKGRASFQYPILHELATFDEPAELQNEPSTIEDLVVTIRRFGQSGGAVRLQIETSAKQADSSERDPRIDRTRVRLKTVPGEDLWLVDTLVWPPEGNTNLTDYVFMGKASAVTAIVFGLEEEVFKDSFDFEFNDIPLPD